MSPAFTTKALAKFEGDDGLRKRRRPGCIWMALRSAAGVVKCADAFIYPG